MYKKQIKFLIIMAFMMTIFISTNAFASSSYTRLAGIDRYETSAKIALNGWTQSDYAVLALGEDYPDALCAAPLAGKYKAPILLTETNSIPTSTLDTIKQLQVKNIFIIGGTGVISQAVQDQLMVLGITTTRLAGETRYDTDIEVAKQLGTVSQIAVVTGEDYADALSMAPIAVKLNMPIILVGKDNIPQAVTDYIATQAITKTYVIGKGTSIKDEVGLPGVTEINGADKYSRNIAIISSFKDSLDFSTICLATGENFADALSGSVLAGLKGNPLILVGSDITNEENLLKLVAPNATIKVLGGIGAVPDNSVIGIEDPVETTTPSAITIPTSNISDDTDISSKFTDEEFKYYVHGYLIGKPMNAPILYSDVKNIKSIDLGALNVNITDISSLNGIEYFTALTSLGCSGNKLTSLDVSKNLALTELYCGYNKLTSLDVSKNTALTSLFCTNNKLTSLDTSRSLTYLDCRFNRLTNIDVSKNTVLKYFYCSENNLTTLDIRNTPIFFFECINNQLKTLYSHENLWDTNFYRPQYADSTRTTTSDSLVITIIK